MNFIKETLDWVNRERAARSIGEPLEDLPRGIPCESCKCPIALALKCEVGSHDAYFYSARDDDPHWCDELALPECAVQFIEAFDDSELPQYDEATA